MGIGKYSPTVSRWYCKDRDWYEKNGGGCIVHDCQGNIVNYALHDKDGYDSYGYHHVTGLDRAGYSEEDYVLDSIEYFNVCNDFGSWLYDDVESQFSSQPVPHSDSVVCKNHEWILIQE